MALASAQVVDKVAALLVAATTAAGSKVYTSRAWPLPDADLPAIRVYADEEEIQPAGVTFPALQRHELTVYVCGYCKATSDLDDAMNGLAAQALSALFASVATTRLSPLNCTTQAKRIERDMTTEGEAAVGRITVSLLVQFNTRNNAPETIL